MRRKQAEIEWDEHDVGSLLFLAATVWYEALHTCRLGFPITIKWFDQDVKVVPCATFTKRMCDRCGSLQKGGDVVATSQLMLRWKCNSPQTGCAQTATHKYMWREQAIIVWSRRVISIAACCHSVKLCRSSFFITTQEKYFVVFRMPNTWKWPEMNMYLDLTLRHFNILMDLDVIIFAWTDLDWNWLFSFELYRNIRFSFGTTGYCGAAG